MRCYCHCPDRNNLLRNYHRLSVLNSPYDKPIIFLTLTIFLLFFETWAVRACSRVWSSCDQLDFTTEPADMEQMTKNKMYSSMMASIGPSYKNSLKPWMLALKCAYNLIQNRTVWAFWNRARAQKVKRAFHILCALDYPTYKQPIWLPFSFADWSITSLDYY